MNYAEVLARSTNSEDALTERVFGLLRYLPATEVVSRLMAYARWKLGPPAGTFDDVRSMSVHFWPRSKGHGIPDVLLLFESAGRGWAVIVECKYGAGKSQWGEALAEEEALVTAEGEERADQLARYWRALRSGALEACPESALVPEASTAVLYLTDDLAPPADEIRESAHAAPTMRLGWLSWGDVLRIALECCAVESIGPSAAVAHDLAEYLAQLGVVSFSGFSRECLLERLRPHEGRFPVQPLWGSAVFGEPPNPNVTWHF